jgi:hypothetical protein
MEGFAVTCPLAPDAPRLLSGFCSSPRDFALDFLQTSPRGNALALWLTFGSAYTWCRDLHPTRFVPCPAHTFSARSRFDPRVVRREAPSSQRILSAAPLVLSLSEGLDRTRYAAKSEHLWMVASSL